MFNDIKIISSTSHEKKVSKRVTFYMKNICDYSQTVKSWTFCVKSYTMKTCSRTVFCRNDFHLKHLGELHQIKPFNAHNLLFASFKHYRSIKRYWNEMSYYFSFELHECKNIEIIQKYWYTIISISRTIESM